MSTSAQGSPDVKTDAAASAPSYWGRPKARFCRLAAILWIFPSAGALLLLLRGFGASRRADAWAAWGRNLAFEEWVALGILLAHAVWVVLAWRYQRVEPLREEKGFEPDERGAVQQPVND